HERHRPVVRALGVDSDEAVGVSARAHPRTLRAVVPGPGVAEPERRKHVDRCRLGSTIGDTDPDEDVVRAGLRVLGEDVEVSALVQGPRVDELGLRTAPRTGTVLLDEPAVWKLALRILVQRTHVGVCRRGIEVIVALLDVFAVVALRAREAEEPLLQYRILPIP